jgi:hypothetical protein
MNLHGLSELGMLPQLKSNTASHLWFCSFGTHWPLQQCLCCGAILTQDTGEKQSTALSHQSMQKKSSCLSHSLSPIVRSCNLSWQLFLLCNSPPKVKCLHVFLSMHPFSHPILNNGVVPPLCLSSLCQSCHWAAKPGGICSSSAVKGFALWILSLAWLIFLKIYKVTHIFFKNVIVLSFTFRLWFMSALFLQHV